MTDSKAFTIDNAKILRKSKETPPETSYARHDEIAILLPRHLLVLALEVDSNIPSWFEREA